MEIDKSIKRSWRFLVDTCYCEDDHSHWGPPYWNIMKETFSLGTTELLNLIAKMVNFNRLGDVYKEIKSSTYFTK